MIAIRLARSGSGKRGHVQYKMNAKGAKGDFNVCSVLIDLKAKKSRTIAELGKRLTLICVKGLYGLRRAWVVIMNVVANVIS